MIHLITMASLQRALHEAIEANKSSTDIETAEVQAWRDLLANTKRGARLGIAYDTYYDESGTLIHSY